MPCSVARRRRWRRWRRWRRRLVAPSFGSATAYVNTPFDPPSIPLRTPCDRPASTSLSFVRPVRPVRLYSLLASAAGLALPVLSFVRCRVRPRWTRGHPRQLGSSVPRVYDYTRLTRVYVHVHANSTHTRHGSLCPPERRDGDRARAREPYTCTRTYCYVRAYNISPSTSGIVCARACHRPVANERTGGRSARG